MRIRMLGILLGVTMITGSLAGCKGNGEVPGEENEDPKVQEETQDEDTGDTNVAGKMVGLSMPTQISERWIRDAAAMKQQLEQKGYEVKVQFAEDDSKLQEEQIRQFIEDGTDCLVVAAAAPDQLSQVLGEAKEQGIPVVAYDRLLWDTDAVSYYATFDSQGIGRQIGTYIVEREDLAKLQKAGGARSIEFFMGDPQDNNGQLLYDGVMEVLKPYLEDGTLECLSGRTSFEDTCIAQWSQETAKDNCQKLLAEYYQERDLDIACTAFDGFAYGVREALEEAGYSTRKDGRQWPLVTGQEAELMAVKNMLSGYQSMSVYKDTGLLAETCAVLVEACITGEEPNINYQTEYDNGAQSVKTYLCGTETVDQSNYRELLVESGYYSEDDLK